MSHFTVVRTRLVDQAALLQALADLGYSVVETHDVAQPLFGYRGDQRLETAEIIIRRQHVGKASNDLGFKRGQDGTFQAIISEFDRERHNQAWLDQLNQRYAYHTTKARLAAQGFDLVGEEVGADGRIHLVLRRVNG